MSVEAKITPVAANSVVVAGRLMPEFHHIGIEPLTGRCGTKISGVDLRKPLSDEALRELRRHLVRTTIIGGRPI